jgi:phospholipid/cholesterol/gamma-HCH transport system substrate-binding protein
MSDLNAALKSMQDVLISISNNPLLRRGIPEQRETTPGGANPRNLDF